MSNLLKETIETLKSNGKTEQDVLWVGSKEAYSTWIDFVKVSDFEYRDGYGKNEIAMDLTIVGKDFWLERHEYDGSEWWEFKSIPVKPKENKKIESVKNDDYEDTVSFKSV